ncbi:methyltransferase domain-containing protein [Streptomyces sp. NPDC048340]|uniref:methyltransferase domain-containing protein n=1 Tax=Streptomyces sp. NPDC048340 TaxID=3365537 RepID=UPI003717D96D
MTATVPAPVPVPVVMPPPEVCEMCEEVRLSGSFATGVTPRTPGDPPGAGSGHGSGQTYGPGPGFSRLVARTRAVDVLSGLGSLLPGYVLVVPRRHTTSLGELPPADLAEAFSVGWCFAERIEREFGHPVVLVEHGSSGAAGAIGAADPGTASAAASRHRTGGSCITHSHLHIFPLSDAAHSPLFAAPGSRKISGLSSLIDTAHRKKNYYFCTWKRDEGYLLSDPDLPSQYARRVWAGTLDAPDLWDWAAFPFLANCQDTTNRLRDPDESDTDRQMRETLLAYGVAARTYAALTRQFTAGSTLPHEIADLARTTRGVVLDAGAGAGRDALCFAANGRRVIALDACLPLLTMTPDEPEVQRVTGDVRSLPLSTASVGAVWCSAVLLHLPPAELLRALREFHRVLESRGAVQVSVKEGDGHASLPMGGENPYRRHFFFYRHGDLIPLARQAGFDVQHTWTEEERDSSDEVQRWIKLRLRRTT